MSEMTSEGTNWEHRLSAADIGAVLGRVLGEGHLRDGAAVVHDLGLLRRKLRALFAAFPAGTLHAVAIKANPLVRLLREIVRCGAGLEAASLEEVHLALAAGCPAERILYDSPAKGRAEIAEALALGVRINADSAAELGRIAALRRPACSHGPIGLRVRPAVGAGRIALTSVGDRGARFGEPVEAAAALFAAHPFLSGLHVHVGSQGCPLDLLVAGAARAAALATTLSHRVRFLDIGGGLPAWYDGGAPPPPTPADWAAALRRAAPRLLLGPYELVTELGRSLLSGTGFAVSPVEYVKEAGGEGVAVVRLGADLLLRTAYRPGEWPHEMLAFDAAGRPKAGPPRPTTVAGPLCFAGDVIGRPELPPLRPGDLLVVRDTGAYTLSLWSRHCNRGLPLALAHDEGRLAVLRRRETCADLVRFWS